MRMIFTRRLRRDKWTIARDWGELSVSRRVNVRRVSCGNGRILNSRRSFSARFLPRLVTLLCRFTVFFPLHLLTRIDFYGRCPFRGEWHVVSRPSDRFAIDYASHSHCLVSEFIIHRGEFVCRHADHLLLNWSRRLILERTRRDFALSLRIPKMI